MPFNFKTQKAAQVPPYEKNLRNNKVDPSADDGQSIAEKEIPHREGDKSTITEHQMKYEHTIAENSDAKVIEKVLNDAKGYVPHRSDGTWLSVPPIAALVEKLRQNRLAKDYKPETKAHWSLSMSDQNADLPAWPKNAPQHDKAVLNNDPDRFKKMNHLPTSVDHKENAKARSKSKTVTPLVGEITTADVERVANGIKTGKALQYDTAIVAILREADLEKRELTPVEQKTIADLKVARTQTLIKT